MRESSLDGMQRMMMADFQASAMRSLKMVAEESQERPAPAPPPPTRLARGLGVGLALGLLVPVSGALLLAFVLGGL